MATIVGGRMCTSSIGLTDTNLTSLTPPRLCRENALTLSEPLGKLSPRLGRTTFSPPGCRDGDPRGWRLGVQGRQIGIMSGGKLQKMKHPPGNDILRGYFFDYVCYLYLGSSTITCIVAVTPDPSAATAVMVVVPFFRALTCVSEV